MKRIKPIHIKKAANYFLISLRKPVIVLRAISDKIMKDKEDYVKNKYGLKEGIPLVDLVDLIGEVDEKIENYTYLGQNSLITDIILLKNLAKRFKKCSFLEIGTWRGESISNVAKVAKECVSISLSDKELRDFGMNDDYISQQRLFSKNIKNISHIAHDSHTFDYKKYGKKFDLIFIDGEHSYEGIFKDTENAFKLLKDENSIIVWHDASLNVEKPNWVTLAAILDAAPKEKRNKIYRVSNTLCAIYFPFSIKSEFKSAPHIPNKLFDVSVKSKDFYKK
jgi:predicted O-methyltransferase YrrM